MSKLKYFASTDALGFPIPGTMKGYKKDPCKCNLVEIKVSSVEDEIEPVIKYHPNGLHYFFQVKGNCCDVVPNSLIASNKRPKGKYREFLNISGYTTVKAEEFIKDDCEGGTIPVGSSTYSKTYSANSLEELQDIIDEDIDNFNTSGQELANSEGTCEQEEEG